MPIFKQGGKFLGGDNKLLTTPWTPSRIPGLIFWGEANKRNVVLNNGNISIWKDSSGNQNNANQIYSSKRPILIENHTNGYPSIYFQNNKQLIISSLPITDSFTIITVIRTLDNDTVYEYGDNLSGTGNNFYLNGGTNSISLTNSGLSSSKSNSSNWLGGSLKIILHQYNGDHSSHKMFINGEFVNLTDYIGEDEDPGSLSILSDLSIGSKQDSSYGIDGFILEYLVYDEYLDFDKSTEITSQMNNKYNVF